jgi:hypothetical protein
LRPALSTAFDLSNEGGDRLADHLRMVLLQEMLARAELDEPAIMELASEIFGKAGGDLGAGVGAKEEFRIGGGGEADIAISERHVYF